MRDVQDERLLLVVGQVEHCSRRGIAHDRDDSPLQLMGVGAAAEADHRPAATAPSISARA
jgi:hypothetical protein